MSTVTFSVQVDDNGAQFTLSDGRVLHLGPEHLRTCSTSGDLVTFYGLTDIFELDYNNCTNLAGLTSGEDLYDAIIQLLPSKETATATNLYLSRFLQDGATFNAIGNYAAAATSFRYAPAAGEIVSVQKLNAYIFGNPTNLTGYGSSPLTNGITVNVSQNSTVTDLTAGQTLRLFLDWSRHSDQIQVNNASTLRQMFTTWKFSVPILLNGDTGDYIEAVLNDDFSSLGLSQHNLVIQGQFQ